MALGEIRSAPPPPPAMAICLGPDSDPSFRQLPLSMWGRESGGGFPSGLTSAGPHPPGLFVPRWVWGQESWRIPFEYLKLKCFPPGWVTHTFRHFIKLSTSPLPHLLGDQCPPPCPLHKTHTPGRGSPGNPTAPIWVHAWRPLSLPGVPPQPNPPAPRVPPFRSKADSVSFSPDCWLCPGRCHRAETWFRDSQGVSAERPPGTSGLRPQATNQTLSGIPENPRPPTPSPRRCPLEYGEMTPRGAAARVTRIRGGKAGGAWRPWEHQGASGKRVSSGSAHSQAWTHGGGVEFAGADGGARAKLWREEASATLGDSQERCTYRSSPALASC
nr:uncharacterized protein LOC108176882 isoform X1 [Oryctolagus cuniculus]XP_051704575.1 uncharacterized protein LOC108176882 isoform X1 [Oryctolagus cuniculus]